ncbi:hypothetical protein CYMTET_24024 [Cymbomonas tetramitiformis]|uniref:Uncharacterized protein n=1 Tax=Cymbomonas tetramitiformis TaxID=36881 RepID=A0AAE0L0P2_9CHLO|nr:hypothetical protein CYMTET_24024 [Cymbomonas tetramitiformis]
MLWRCIERFTREQVAEAILQLVEELEARRVIESAREETVSRREMVEGLFRGIHVWQLDKPSPGDYYKYLYKYVTEGMTPGHAYLERSHIYSFAKAFLQARADARSAIEIWERLQGEGRDLDAFRLPRCLQDQPGTTRPFKWVKLHPLGLAYFRLGEAYQAEQNHPDQSWVDATKAFMRAVDLDHNVRDYQGSLSDAGSMLSNKQMSEVLNEVYNEAGKNLLTPLALGITDQPDGVNSMWRCEAKIRFPEAKPRDFTAKIRDLFRMSLAGHLDLPKLKVMIEGVRPPNMVAKDGLPLALEISFQVARRTVLQLRQPLTLHRNVWPERDMRSLHEADDARSSHEADDARSSHVADDARSSHVADDARSLHGADDARSSHAADDARSLHAADDARSSHAADDARSLHDANDARSLHAADDARSLHGADDARSSHEADDARSLHGADDARSSHAADDARSSHEADDARSLHGADDARSLHEADDARSSHAADDARSSHAADDARSLHEADDARSSHAADDARSSHEADDARSLHGADDARSLHAADDARSLHEADDARSSHEADDARSLHAADDARSLHAADDARSLHGADDARSLHGADDARSLHGADDARSSHEADDARSLHGADDARSLHEADDALS